MDAFPSLCYHLDRFRMSVRSRAWIGLLFLVPGLVCAQVETGEVRLSVSDSTGLALPSSGTLVSEASQTRREFKTDDTGHFTFQRLPFGMYRITVEHRRLYNFLALFEIRSAVPRESHVELKVQSASTEVVVMDAATLLDPHRTGVIYSVGAQQIREQQSPIPGRGVLDLVNMQPGWLLEANAVPHPRGSEYQTLFVVDGVPMDENRSPGFAPDLDTGDVQSMSILTGNYPAEYGRKLGGIVEVTSSHDIHQGLHGSAEVGGGSFGAATGFLSAIYGWNRSAFTVSASGEHTDRYLDPPVLGNYTNTGTLGSVSGSYDQDLSESDRIHFSVHRKQSGVPGAERKSAAGCRPAAGPQCARRSGPGGMDARVFAAAAAQRARVGRGSFVEFVVERPVDADHCVSGARLPARLRECQSRRAQEATMRSRLAAMPTMLRLVKALHYQITDPSFFDDGTPLNFNFLDHRLDREQALFAQDTMRFGNLTLSAGIRWDHYSLVVNDNAWSPRLGAAWYCAEGRSGAALFLRPRLHHARHGKSAAGQFAAGGQREPADVAHSGAAFARQLCRDRLLQGHCRKSAVGRQLLPADVRQLRR